MQNSVWTRPYDIVVQPAVFSHPDQGFCSATQQACSFGKVRLFRFWAFKLVCGSNWSCYYLLFHFCPWCFLFLEFLHPETSCRFFSLVGILLFSCRSSNRPLAKCCPGSEQAEGTRLLWSLLLAFSPWVVISCDGSSEWNEPSCHILGSWNVRTAETQRASHFCGLSVHILAARKATPEPKTCFVHHPLCYLVPLPPLICLIALSSYVGLLLFLI